eukprot:CAMPEP_0197854694 /NCGR_PEP_ID=MMETSP1438-20131217/25147_1 /TAXON_ID=1461541 /ORGANISM="Pterosperma sp., Strain CCMP1384" /LENGTH=53 /DNA_ID=CAMNT_0043469525 /DNA_START=90 /DNA_END=248 /DNA_ORIENTATION=-
MSGLELETEVTPEEEILDDAPLEDRQAENAADPAEAADVAESGAEAASAEDAT